MKRQNLFRVANFAAFIQAVMLYHYFWMETGRYGFNFSDAISVLIVVVIVIIGFNLARTRYLERKHSIIMTSIYLSPFIFFYICKFFDNTMSFDSGILAFLLFIAPLAISALIYGVSIPLKE